MDNLGFGNSCTYKVKSKCGYPTFTLNNTDLDVIVAYKKKQWSNDSYEPDEDEKYLPSETFNPKSEHGEISWKMHEDEKKDHNTTNDTDCQDTKMYVTVINLY